MLQRSRQLVEKPSIAVLLDRQQVAFDELMAEVRNGPRDQRHWDDLEEKGQTIAAGIVAAFRGRR